MRKLFSILFVLLVGYSAYGQGNQSTGAPTQLNSWKGAIKGDSALYLPVNYTQYRYFDSCGRMWFNKSGDSAVYFNDCKKQVKLLSMKDTAFIRSFIGNITTQVDSTVFATRAYVQANKPLPGSGISIVGNTINNTGVLSLNGISGALIRTTLAQYGITDGVPSNRTITINGTTQDLSANITFTTPQGTVTSNGWGTTLTGGGTIINVDSSKIHKQGGDTYAAPSINGTNDAQPFIIKTSNAVRDSISASGTRYFTGNALWGATNTIGFVGSSKISTIADGSIQFLNAAGNAFSRWHFGPANATWFLIRRNGTNAEFRTGDDAAYYGLRIESLTVSALGSISTAGRMTLTTPANGIVNLRDGTGTAGAIVSLGRVRGGYELVTSATYTVSTTVTWVEANTSSNSIVVTLSNMATGDIIHINKPLASNTLTITPSTGLINGQPTISFTAQYTSLTIGYNGTNYSIL